MHFGARDVERFGDQRFGSFVDIAELLLQRVQDQQQRTFAIKAFPDAGQRDVLVPRDAGLLAASLMHCGHPEDISLNMRQYAYSAYYYVNNSKSKRAAHK